MKTMNIISHCPAMPNGMTHAQFQGAVDDLVHKVIQWTIQGYDTFVTDGSQGFAQVAFWAVDKAKRQGFKIRNVLALPFHDQDLRWMEEGCFGKKDYALMLKRADEVTYATTTRPSNGGFITNVMKKLAKNNVLNADANVAFWPGGTACDVKRWNDCKGKSIQLETMRVAQSAGKLEPVFVYNAGKDGIVDGNVEIMPYRM